MAPESADDGIAFADVFGGHWLRRQVAFDDLEIPLPAWDRN